MMQLSIWDIFKAIYKGKIIIACALILSLILCYFYVQRAQTYKAEIVIKYNDGNVSKGLNPKSEKFDVYEIMTPSIIENAINDLNLNIGIESVRNGLIITPIIPKDIQELKKSKIKNGEEYTYYPNQFAVSYSMGSPGSGVYTRNMLEAIMKNYDKFYYEKYLNQSVVPEGIKSMPLGQYDYLEILDMINGKISDSITYLISKNGSDKEFRSPKTGLSFNDLIRRYDIIKNNYVNLLYAYVYSGRLTINKDNLISKFRYNIEQEKLASEKENQAAITTLNILNTFVESSKKDTYNRNTNPNTSNSNPKAGADNTVNNAVIDKDYRPGETTYDSIMNQYVDAQIESNISVGKISQYQNVIDTYSNDNVSPEEKERLTMIVKGKLQTLDTKLGEINQLTNLSISDYRDYISSKYITYLSSVNISTGKSLRLYMMISVAIGLGAGILIAIVMLIIGKKKDEVQLY